MIFLAGIVLLVLGLASGALLLLIPLGVVAGAAGFALWIFFPLFAVSGFLMAASAGRNQAVPMLSRASGAALMLLALVAAVALVLQAAAIFQPAGDTLSLWYVLVLGVVLGATGLASRRRPDAAS